MELEDEKPAWRSESFAEGVRTIAYALLIALAIRTFLFQPFNIPSSSMEGTLLVGDYLFVSKYSYGYSRYSLPFASMLPTFGRVWDKPPTRGDVAVFRFPPDPTQDYIKRVIGLPGDRIQVINALLHINGAPVKLEAAGEANITCPYGGSRPTKLLRETLPNGVSHMIAQCDVSGAQNNTQEFVVPPGHYFMMGDNRDNSQDSRVSAQEGGVGFVPQENLVGRADVIFFSTDLSAGVLEFWRWPFAIRYERLFDGIH
jgi:signal peptidase I